MNLTLIKIERNLQRKSRSLNKLIYEERSYNPAEQLQEYNNLFLNLTGKYVKCL